MNGVLFPIKEGPKFEEKLELQELWKLNFSLFSTLRLRFCSSDNQEARKKEHGEKRNQGDRSARFKGKLDNVSALKI